MCNTTEALHPAKRKGKPAWLKKSLPKGGDYQRVTRLLSKANLHTVCQEANCPNMFECFSKNTSTFMILGSECTRHCRFCNITANQPQPVDYEEPMRVANAARELNLKYVVVTSVTRDDLEEGGASHFAAVIKAIKSSLPQTPDMIKGSIKKPGKNSVYEKSGISVSTPTPTPKVEVLIPDFKGDINALKIVTDAMPDVINHNIETVASLYEKARPEARYQRSLDLIRNIKILNPDMPAKSGIMVGLGETMEELVQTMRDLFDHGCDILTIGQYLQPTGQHLTVEKYYPPEEFKEMEQTARQIGFKGVAAGPFVRSSYQAQELFETCPSFFK